MGLGVAGILNDTDKLLTEFEEEVARYVEITSLKGEGSTGTLERILVGFGHRLLHRLSALQMTAKPTLSLALHGCLHLCPNTYLYA